MTEMKRQLRKIAETWENNNGTTGFAEFICWKGSDGKKKTSAFYEKEEEILDEFCLNAGTYRWTKDSWVNSLYQNWRTGLTAMILASDQKMDIIDWLEMKMMQRYNE